MRESFKRSNKQSRDENHQEAERHLGRNHSVHHPTPRMRVFATLQRTYRLHRRSPQGRHQSEEQHHGKDQHTMRKPPLASLQVALGAPDHSAYRCGSRRMAPTTTQTSRPQPPRPPPEAHSPPAPAAPAAAVQPRSRPGAPSPGPGPRPAPSSDSLRSCTRSAAPAPVPSAPSAPLRFL